MLDTENEEDTVTIKKWVKRGIMLCNTECLDPDDPDHPYNQVLAQGKKPEDYGIKHPHAVRFDNMSRAELIDLILGLEREVNAYARAGF